MWRQIKGITFPAILILIVILFCITTVHSAPSMQSDYPSHAKDRRARPVDIDGDGYRSNKDCDDNNAQIFPGATEIPNDGIDQDCNGADQIIGDGTSPPGDDGGGTDPHANLNFADYPGNCLSCHAAEAEEVLDSTHYKWIGDAPDMINGVGLQQGKLTNAVNSYCINIEGNWPVCGTCHVGLGKRPDDPQATTANIDCLVCHNETYAAQRKRLADGSMGVEQPSDLMVQNVHKPTRANCLGCHAKAGGGDGVKRGDLSLQSGVNAEPSFDVHMNTAGADLNCQSCHVFEKHKTIGKGSDLRPTDDLARGSEVSCLTCHSDKNTPSGHTTARINDHVARVACQTCHIPTYAKVATEVHRDWRTHHDGSAADGVSGPGHPHTEKLSDLIPVYAFWNRKSDNYLLGDDARRTYDPQLGTYPTSRPRGTVDDPESKIFPFKYKTASQPITANSYQLIAVDTLEYLKVSGDIQTAIENGLDAMGFSPREPYKWVMTDTFGLLNHGISPASDALQCGDCHGAGAQMDLKGELGYQLKGSKSVVCYQCHGSEEEEGFYALHEEHVRDERIDCSSCHSFSRPERRLRSGVRQSDS